MRHTVLYYVIEYYADNILDLVTVLGTSLSIKSVVSYFALLHVL
jgi:hypothetical protein